MVGMTAGYVLLHDVTTEDLNLWRRPARLRAPIALPNRAQRRVLARLRQSPLLDLPPPDSSRGGIVAQTAF